MYYNRKISDSFAQLIKESGDLRWLYHFVKNHDDLDILIGKNHSKEFISVYRGLSRLITIQKTSSPNKIKIDGANSYKALMPDLYGKKDATFDFKNSMDKLLHQVVNNEKFDRYYNNRKEGYFQNQLSRKYGIDGKKDSDFVIIDKEAVIGYSNQKEKDRQFGELQKKYKKIQREISSLNAKSYGKDLGKKAIGNELDFLVLDKNGNVLLIEYKQGQNTSGIYLSPLQIGLYYELFRSFPKPDLEKAVFEMLKQKQEIGLIPHDWNPPNGIKNIIPVLIISEYNYRSSAKKKYQEILDICRKKLGNDFLRDIKTYNYTEENGLTDW